MTRRDVDEDSTNRRPLREPSPACGLARRARSCARIERDAAVAGRLNAEGVPGDSRGLPRLAATPGQRDNASQPRSGFRHHGPTAPTPALDRAFTTGLTCCTICNNCLALDLPPAPSAGAGHDRRAHRCDTTQQPNARRKPNAEGGPRDSRGLPRLAAPPRNFGIRSPTVLLDRKSVV